MITKTFIPKNGAKPFMIMGNNQAQAIAAIRQP